MKPTTLAALVALFIATAECAAAAAGRAGPRVVKMDTQRQPTSNPVQRDRIRRRSQTVQAALDNKETLYYVNGSLGTPPQPLRLHLDTGSSDLWVNSPRSNECLQSSSPCKFAGTYAANASSTYAYVGSWFNITYVDGSGASGDYATDSFSIGSTTLQKLQFGIGYESSSTQGILGLGYKVNEAQVGRARKPAYDNLPAQMVADGLIHSNAYSLWLNDLDSNTGSVLFGGVDTQQYTGNLQTLPIQSESGTYAEFLITLTSLGLGNTTVAGDLALAVLLDSGSSLTYLPDTVVNTIYGQVGAQYDDSAGVAYVPCSLANSQTNLTFTFSSPTITVAMDELVLDMILTSGQRPTFSDGATACLFGVAPAGAGTNVLGDTFLRSAYVVFDLDNNAISLAQTRPNATASSVREITTGPHAVPDATLVANPVAATAGLAGNAPGSAAGLRGFSSAAGPAGVLRVSSAACAASLFLGLTTFLP